MNVFENLCLWTNLISKKLFLHNCICRKTPKNWFFFQFAKKQRFSTIMRHAPSLYCDFSNFALKACHYDGIWHGISRYSQLCPQILHDRDRMNQCLRSCDFHLHDGERREITWDNSIMAIGPSGAELEKSQYRWPSHYPTTKFSESWWRNLFGNFEYIPGIHVKYLAN